MEESHAAESPLGSSEASSDVSVKLGDNALRCLACAHRCLIAEGQEGICKVRFNNSTTYKWIAEAKFCFGCGRKLRMGLSQKERLFFEVSAYLDQEVAEAFVDAMAEGERATGVA